MNCSKRIRCPISALDRIFRRGRFVGVIFVCLILSFVANAWADPASEAQRVEEFAKAREKLADPNPVSRLVSMDAIVKSGDTTLIQYVLRIALAGDDANLRALALRAYLASIKQLTFVIEIPPNLQKAYEQASLDKTHAYEFSRQYPMIVLYEQVGLRFTLAIVNYDLSRSSGDWGEVQARSKHQFTVSGDRVSSSLDIVFLSTIHHCIVDFSSTRDLRIIGMLACQGSGASPPVRIVAPMF